MDCIGVLAFTYQEHPLDDLLETHKSMAGIVKNIVNHLSLSTQIADDQLVDRKTFTDLMSKFEKNALKELERNKHESSMALKQNRDDTARAFQVIRNTFSSLIKDMARQIFDVQKVSRSKINTIMAKPL